MKKTLNIIAVLTTSLTIAFGMCANVTAAELSDENSYDINNKEYREMIDNLGENIPYEEEFVAYLNAHRIIFGDAEDSAITHIYNAEYNNDSMGVNRRMYYVEEIISDTNKKGRKLTQIYYYWGEDDFDESSYSLSFSDETLQKYSVDEINTYLKDQNLDAYVKCKVIKDESYMVVHYNDTSEENVVATFLALNKKYGAVMGAYAPNMSMEYAYVYYDNSVVVGDANQDNILNIRDSAFIAKSLAQNEAASFPKWVDYFRDGTVDIRDAAAIAKSLAEK